MVAKRNSTAGMKPPGAKENSSGVVTTNVNKELLEELASSHAAMAKLMKDYQQLYDKVSDLPQEDVIQAAGSSSNQRSSSKPQATTTKKTARQDDQSRGRSLTERKTQRGPSAAYAPSTKIKPEQCPVDEFPWPSENWEIPEYGLGKQGMFFANNDSTYTMDALQRYKRIMCHMQPIRTPQTPEEKIAYLELCEKNIHRGEGIKGCYWKASPSCEFVDERVMTKEGRWWFWWQDSTDEYYRRVWAWYIMTPNGKCLWFDDFLGPVRSVDTTACSLWTSEHPKNIAHRLPKDPFVIQ